MEKSDGSVRHKRGHNTIMTGLTMLLAGVVLAIMFTNARPGFSGFCVLVAVAGLVTTIVGIGRRRERPVDQSSQTG